MKRAVLAALVAAFIVVGCSLQMQPPPRQASGEAAPRAWTGKETMITPPVDKRLDNLHPMFRAALQGWLVDVAAQVGHVDMRVTETRRTFERQRYLYAQGRERPYDKAPTVTWTLKSRHRWGLAADLAMIRNATGEAIWEVSSWDWLYRKVPPERYGLRHLAPLEWLHLEYRYADQAIEEADALGLVRT